MLKLPSRDYLLKELCDFKVVVTLLSKGKGSLSDYLLVGAFLSVGVIIGSIF